jgi:hypothetical protein
MALAVRQRILLRRLTICLVLREDELEDVVIGAEEVTELQKEARWLSIAKVHTSRSFSSDAFIGKMKAIWNLSIRFAERAGKICLSSRCIV